MTANARRKLVTGLAWVYTGVLVLLPFHALFTTWIGSNAGHLDVWRIWKEVILTVSLPFVAYLAWTNRQTRDWLLRSWLVRLIGLYIVLFLGYGVLAKVWGHVSTSALLYAWLANLRFLVFFVAIVVVAVETAALRRWLPRLVLIPAAIVVAFGLLQRLLLPYDFLRHFGYGPSTIPAYQTVDNKIDYRRIQSTLRGANPLGAYLVVVLSLVITKWRRWWGSVLLFAGLMVLFWSYSRSAYLGLAVALAIIAAVRLPKRLYQVTGMGITLLVLLGGIGVYALRQQPVVQNTLFHTDNNSRSKESSNAGRAAALERGVHDVTHEPFGEGPGTAGPESTRNVARPARIAENYYLQIGQEVGLLGLALFVTINVLVGLALWRIRADDTALALFAAFVGLSLVNLLSHAWSDDTLGMLWWGLAGITLAPAILKSRSQHETKTTQKTRARS